MENFEDSKMVDLSELENFSFQPDWAKNEIKQDFTNSDFEPSGSAEKKRFQRSESQKSRFDKKFDKNKSDRKPFPRGEKGSAKFNNGRVSDSTFSDTFRGKRFSKTRNHGNDNPHHRTRHWVPFKPVVEVEFYPNDSVYDAIASALKATRKTYELFNVAKLFLDKPERFAMVVKKHEDQTDKELYLTKDDDFVFATENEAIFHVFSNHLDKYFDIQEREISQPEGNFSCLHRCGITGTNLCPPNYHKYHEILMDHHEKYLSKMPFDRFKSRIEKITDPEEINKWKLECSKIKIYIPKGISNDGDQIPEISSENELRKHFSENFKSKSIIPFNSVRISGETFMKMPRNLLSKSMFVAIEREKQFPLKFSNNLRGRLRRSGFTIYKIGGKSGISYVSGIKRKFRTTGDIFADDIQMIISIIDSNPKITVTSVCLKCIQNSNKREENNPSVTAVDGNESVEGKEAVVNSDLMESCGYVSSSDDIFSAENQDIIKNLHWLIREGYVAEFEDGKLLATEVMTEKQQSANPEQAVLQTSEAD